MTKDKPNKVVYTPKPDLTMYRDTYLKCELINSKDEKNSRLKIISVHTGRDGLLADLTAERSDEVILVDNEDVYQSLEELKRMMS